ncbi:MAG: RnfABCDGE type electron transport complex subunit B [Oscillospiraceae bacterium]|nr:RnfABCDGE type electron transport complex subunit B [Oscillospiraceae bacterium]
MSGVFSAIWVLCAIGAVCSLLLVVASKYMSGPEDEKFPALRACLPGANCGACGYAGCDGYAKALAAGTEEKTNLCVPGADAAAAAIAEVLGVEAEDVVEMRAYVRCNGDCEKSKHKYQYAGINNCSAANILFQGEWACPNSCLGYGDCERTCPSDAIHVYNGVARVDPAKCTGCGMCARQCPNHLIGLRRAVDPVIVRCSNTQNGATVRKACINGCIGCKKCEKTCAHDAIHVIDNLAHIDYDKCVGCGECVGVCPVGVLQKF